MYFLAMEMTSLRLASIISFLALLASRSPFLYGGDDAPEFADGQAGFPGNLGDALAQGPDVALVLGSEGLPPLALESAHTPEPAGIQLVIPVVLQEILAADPWTWWPGATASLPGS